MDELNWIKEVSNTKVTLLTYLIGMRIPSNLGNAFLKRRDLLESYQSKIEKLNKEAEDGSVEKYVTATIHKKIVYLIGLANQYGASGCRDTRRYGQGKHVNNALKGLKKTVKESIELINNGEDSLWWLEDDDRDNGRFYYRGDSNDYTYRKREEKWWKKYVGERKTF